MAYLRRCVSVLVTLSVLLSFGVFAPPAGGTAAAAEIQVSSGESIQDAIDSAAPGDVIIVGPGTYAEDLVIDKALTVVSSDGSDATTIAGLVDIDLLDNETLVFGGEGAGFTVTNPNGPGIDATLDYWCALTIEGNAISGNDTVGLRVRRVHYFSEVEVRGNEISENGEAGIEAGAFGPAVRYHSTLSILDNVITNNADEGIDWNDTWDNSHGLIQGNTITGNGDDGIWHDDVEHGSSLNILDNVVSDNVGRGIYIYEYEDGCEGLIQGNTIERNGEDGFYMSDDPSHGSRLTIRDNSFVQNGGFGLRMDDVEDRGYLAIIDNEIVDNESGGIRLYEVDSGAEGLISGNTITGNGGFGIYVYSGLDYGGYLLIEGNTISGTQSGVVTNEEPGGWDVEYWLEHGDVAPGSETVYVNGVPVSESDYLLVHDSGTIVFDAVPSGAVTVDYTYGGAGIYVGDEVGEGSDLAIRDNQVVDNGGKGIYVEEIERGGEVVIAEGNTISRNGAHGVVVGSRYYDSWYKEWIYYGVVDGSFLEVADNEISDNGGNGVDILLIEDGSKVLIESNTLSENAYGVYVGEMNEGSTLDILGNTITGQSSGGVYAANIDESEVNVLDNVISANTGIGLQVGEGETLSDSKATIRCNTIYNNTEWGIYMVVEHSLVDISGNHILANGTSGTEGGIHVQGAALDLVGIHQNSIAGNYDWGLLNASAEEVDATYNWWGDVDGPYQATTNTGGGGDEVSDNVDFSDWLSAAPALCAEYVPETATPVTITVGDDGEDFSSIQAAIDDAEPGDIILVSPGTYSENLTIEKSLTLHSTDGAESTTIDGMVAIDLVDAATVTFGGADAGFTVTGSSPGFEVRLSSWSQLTIQGNSINGCDDNGIYVERVRRWSLLSVLDNAIADNSYDGISIDEILDFGEVRIEGNVISRNDEDGISVQTVHYAGALEIRDNIIEENSGTGINLFEYGVVRYGSSASIVDNEIRGNGFDGECNRGRGIRWMNVFDGSEGLVQGNTITGNARDGFYFDDVEHGSSLDLVNNLVADNGGRGIHLFEYEDGCAGLIQGNTITGNGRDGFYMSDDPSDGSRVTIEQNTITGNGGKGLRVDDVEDGGHLAIVDNVIEDNQGIGIYLYEVDSGSDCLIDGNTITNNAIYGVYVSSGADYGGVLTLTGNTISGTRAELHGVYVGFGCGGETYFYLGLPEFSLVPGSATIYLDGVEVSAADYYLDYEYGEIYFDTAPGDGVFISADYALENAGWGIYVNNDVDEGSVLTIAGNVVTDNLLSGIFIRDIGAQGAGAVIIEANTVSGNGAHGIAVGTQTFNWWDEIWDYYGVRNGSSLSMLDNEISDNAADGINVHQVDNGSIVRIDGNAVTGSCGAALWLCGDAETLKDSEAYVLGNVLDANDGWGLYGYLEHALLDVSGCNQVTSNAGGGIYLDGSDMGLVGIHNNNIKGNTEWGLLNDSDEMVDALTNWWGDGSGPYQADTNTAGLGDPVSDNVLYNPWMTASCEPSSVSAAFAASARSGAPGLSVRFTDRSTSGCDIVAWLWDFGDGGSSTAQNPTHVFLREGTFTVTLTVWDSCGHSDTITMQAYISIKKVMRNLREPSGDDAPEPASLGVSYLYIDPIQVLPGQTVTVSANVCNSGEERGNRTVSFMVNGEAVESQSVSVSGGACQQVTFTVARVVPGAYQVAIDGMVGQFSVVAPRTVTQSVASQQQTGLGTAGIIAIIAVMLVLIAALIMVFRRT
jgi:PKD repeat protein